MSYKPQEKFDIWERFSKIMWFYCISLLSMRGNRSQLARALNLKSHFKQKLKDKGQELEEDGFESQPGYFALDG